MKRIWTTISAFLLIWNTGEPLQDGTDYLWWEAEDALRTNFPASNPFAPEDESQADALSEGVWVGAAGERAETLFLEYEVEIPRTATYSFYVRKFWKHGPFRWRFGEQAWRSVGQEISLLDAVELRQFIVANWVSLGTVSLEAGRQTLRLEALENDGAIAFDAFLLTTEPFVPRGKLKPGEKLVRAPEGWFAFDPTVDRFEKAKLDLRFLNEDYAGQFGYIQAERDHFIHGDTGKPVRFWGVNAGSDIARMDDASLDYLARHLAKLGVNIVRYHGAIYDRSSADLAKVDEGLLERIFYLVTALKEEGIYTSLSIYFPLWVQMEEKYGFEGYGGEHPFALLFFNEEFQKNYMAWWRELLTTTNPYTGKTLAQDPAVAFAELVNEDSYFFWTFTPYQNIPGDQMHILEEQFADWLEVKYGSLEEAKRAWPAGSYTGDDWDSGRVGFVPIWDMFNRRTSSRSRDTVTFLTLHQKGFFEEMITFLKEELGFRGAIYGSNWKTADDRYLGPLDKFSNTVADFMDRHGYFGSPHEGERASYSLSEGDRYDDRSALLFEGQEEGFSFDIPIVDLMYNGKPSTISEINWSMPNRFRADMPMLSAAYGVLQGTDGFFFFALSGASWQQTHNKFPLQTPVTMGQFPAFALLYRQGLVQPGEVVFHGGMKLDDLFALQGAPVTAPQSLDLFRSRDVPDGGLLQTDEPGQVDPLAFLVGQVGLSVTEEGEESSARDLSPFIDREGKVVESTTGELRWNYGNGLMTVNAARAQGATGFLSAAGAVRLDDVIIEVEMEYGTVVVVALDGKPLQVADRMLLQVMSEDANYGWEAPGDGMRDIEDLGSPPIVIRDFMGKVSLRREDAGSLQVTALDFSGYGEQVSLGANPLKLKPNTLYYLISRSSAGDTAVDEETAAFPEKFKLAQNFPNPFNNSTVIRFDLPEEEDVELEVFDLAGQRVASLVEAKHLPGPYTVVWDGRDSEGDLLASGLYLYQLRAGAQLASRKLLLLR